MPGGIATASRKARRGAHGSTSATNACLESIFVVCSQHRPKHFNEGTQVGLSFGRWRQQAGCCCP